MAFAKALLKKQLSRLVTILKFDYINQLKKSKNESPKKKRIYVVLPVFLRCTNSNVFSIITFD
jgi:hypothetical protein